MASRAAGPRLPPASDFPQPRPALRSLGPTAACWATSHHSSPGDAPPGTSVIMGTQGLGAGRRWRSCVSELENRLLLHGGAPSAERMLTASHFRVT